MTKHLSISLSHNEAICLEEILSDLAQAEDGEGEVVNSMLKKVTSAIEWYAYLQEGKQNASSFPEPVIKSAATDITATDIDGTYYILVARNYLERRNLQIGYEAAKYSNTGGYIQFSEVELGKAKFHRIKHWKPTSSNYSRASNFLFKNKQHLQLPQRYYPEIGTCRVENGLIVEIA